MMMMVVAAVRCHGLHIVTRWVANVGWRTKVIARIGHGHWRNRVNTVIATAIVAAAVVATAITHINIDLTEACRSEEQRKAQE